MPTRVTSDSEKKQNVPKAAAIFRWALRYRSLRGRSDNGFCRGYYVPRRAKPSLAGLKEETPREIAVLERARLPERLRMSQRCSFPAL